MRLLATSIAATLLGLAAVLSIPAGADSAPRTRTQAEAGTSAPHDKGLPRVASRVRVAKRHHRPHRRVKHGGASVPKAPAESSNTGSGAGNRGSLQPSAPKPTPTLTPTPAPIPQPTPEAPGAGSRLLFASNFDSGFSGWYVQSLPGRATISTAHPFAGSGAARLEVRPGDIEPDTGNQRSEVSGPTFNAGEDIFVRDVIRVPDGYSFQGPWQLIDQLHEEHWAGSPGIATFLDSSRRISFGAGDSSPIYWRGPQLESERWYDLVFRVNLSIDPGQGFVELWLDGFQQVLANGSARMYGETIQAAQTYLKAGIYRSQYSTGTSIVEHDAIAVGTSFAAVNSY